MLFKSLIRNKKGIVIISDIFDSIKTLISWFISTLPRPALFVLFLFFIIFLANFITPLLANGLGYHCDSNGAVWKLSGFAIFDNFDLLTDKPDFEEQKYLNLPFMCDLNPEFLKTCTNCNFTGSGYFWDNYNCTSNGYRLEDYSSIKEKLYCITYGCGPPEYYFYNLTADKFQCFDIKCINESINNYNSRIYESEGAIPVYINKQNSFSVDSAVYLKCDKDNPTSIKLTFFGIDIFNYKLWLILMLIGFIMWFYINVTRK